MLLYNRLTDYSLRVHKLTKLSTLLSAPVLPSRLYTSPPIIENLLIYFFQYGPPVGAVWSVNSSNLTYLLCDDGFQQGKTPLGESHLEMF